MDNVIIRRATTRDLPTLCGLLEELFAIELDFQADRTRQQRGLELLLTRGDDALVLVAEEGATVVGMCTAQVVISTAEGGPVALLEDVVVTRQRRGRGIGAGLLTAAEAWAWERGLRRLQLLADRNNGAALEFYARQGWQPTRMVALRKKPT